MTAPVLFIFDDTCAAGAIGVRHYGTGSHMTDAGFARISAEAA